MQKHYEDFSEQAGLENLEQMHRFIHWMYEQVQPWLGKHVLEAGCGIGTYSAKAWEEGKQVTAVEISENYFQYLQKRFTGKERFEGILGDLENPELIKTLAQKKIDTIFSLNVLEHVKKDAEVLKSFNTILPTGGILVVLVPAHQFLHNSLDVALGHVRRYSKKELREKVEAAGFKITKLYSFNALAILGWYVNGNLMKKDEVDQTAARMYDRLVPMMRWFEKYILRRSVGISLIVVAEKI